MLRGDIPLAKAWGVPPQHTRQTAPPSLLLGRPILQPEVAFGTDPVAMPVASAALPSAPNSANLREEEPVLSVRIALPITPFRSRWRDGPPQEARRDI